MTGIDARDDWSDAALDACRSYADLVAIIDDLPAGEGTELARQMAIDLAFRLSGWRDADNDVDAALTSISAVCQSCLFDLSRVPASQ
ncbi:MAG: hypothetical protein AAGD13_10025 [Pseudomonadota bacterium]